MPRAGEKVKYYTVEELEWLARNSKKLEDMANNRPYLLSKDKIETQLELAARFGYFWSLDQGTLLDDKVKEKQQDDGTVKVPATVDALQFAKSLVDKSIDSLENKIIPGYEKKSNGPKNQKKYEPYINNAKKTRDVLKGLSQKLEA